MIGETLAHYRVTRKLGEGGMGEVYLAEDLKLKREVALKLLPSRRAAAPGQLERFRREAEAVAALNHPNIVTIHSVEEGRGEDGAAFHFLTMELVEGETLDRLVPDEGLDRGRLLDLAIQIADAMAAAHAKGITHRDLKPANVMVSASGRVKVLDFGLARLTDGDDGSLATHAPTELITQEGTVLGTFPYMSPEQAEGKALDARSDIFSFGVVLYEMATGVRPFQGGSSAALVSSILKDEARPIEELRAHLPRQLGRIVRHCLEKDPSRRFQSALDVRNELEALRREVETEEGASPPVSALPRSPSERGPKRNRWVRVSVLALAILLAVLAWRFLARPDAPTSAPSPQPSVAVFPFQNLTETAEIDYLRLAVPDEVTTALSRAPGLAVRPFATTSAYSAETFDPVAAGEAVRAANVVTGQFFVQNGQLQLTLEAIDVANNQLLWRESVNGSIDNLIELRAVVAEQVRLGLLPRLGAAGSPSTGTVPTNEEAYALFLRGLALGVDVEPNRRAIALLEESVELDATYAPAWTELGRRYYYEGNYGRAGESMYDASNAAARRALALDPRLVRPAVRLITNRIETGELEGAWEHARQLLEEHPGDPLAHFAMSYALRYGGLLEEALVECERALAIDPTNPRFRSCGITAYLAGRTERSETFLRLDGASDMYFDNLAMLRVRQGDPAGALQVLSSTSPDLYFRRYLRLCLNDQPPAGRDALAQTIESETLRFLDGEQQYWTASYLSYCGDPERALRLLGAAVERGYCAFPLVDRDPLLESARSQAGFAEVRAAARACHERFLDHRRNWAGQATDARVSSEP